MRELISNFFANKTGNIVSRTKHVMDHMSDTQNTLTTPKRLRRCKNECVLTHGYKPHVFHYACVLCMFTNYMCSPLSPTCPAVQTYLLNSWHVSYKFKPNCLPCIHTPLPAVGEESCVERALLGETVPMGTKPGRVEGHRPSWQASAPPQT